MKQSGIPKTRARKSTWYAVNGTFQFNWLKDADTWNNALEIYFLPDGDVEKLLLVPADELGGRGLCTIKILALLREFSISENTKSLPGPIHLCNVVRAGVDEHWSAYIVSEKDCAKLSSISASIAGSNFTSQWLAHLVPFAHQVDIPYEYLNDEELYLQPIQHGTHITFPPNWNAIVSEIAKISGLEKDQVVPELQLKELGMDSLDAVLLISGLEEVLDTYIEDDLVEELFDQNFTLEDFARKLDEILQTQSK